MHRVLFVFFLACLWGNWLVDGLIIRQKIVPVFHNLRPSFVPRLSDLLLASRIDEFSVSLRQQYSLESLEDLISRRTQSWCVGGATISDMSLLKSVNDLNLDFITTPFVVQDVITAATSYQLPCLAGCCNESSINEAILSGTWGFKIFPFNAIPASHFAGLISSIESNNASKTIFISGGLSLELYEKVSRSFPQIKGIIGIDCKDEDSEVIHSQISSIANFNEKSPFQ